VTIAESDKVRARYHLGYVQIASAYTFNLGVPAAIQTQFMIEGALNNVLPQAEQKFVWVLDQLDMIECQMITDRPNLAATHVDEIGINLKEFRYLREHYLYFQTTLANMLACPPNPFDQRPGLGQGYGAGSVINARVNE